MRSNHALIATLIAGLTTAIPFATQAKNWAVGDCTKVYRNLPYQDKNVFWDGGKKQVTLSGMRNEWVAFQVVLNSSADRAKVNVAISAWDGPGALPPARLYKLWYHEVKYPSTRTGSMGRNWYPDACIPFVDPYPPAGTEPRAIVEPFALKANENQAIYVDTYIPADAKPGVYKATISITGDEKDTFQVALTVGSKTLPLENTLHVFFDMYGGRYGEGEGQGMDYLPKNLVKLGNYERQAYAHGIALNYFYNCSGMMPVVSFKDGKINVNWDNFDAFFGPILTGKFNADGGRPNIFPLPFTEGWWGSHTPEEMTLYVKEICRHFAEKGYPLDKNYTVIYLADETGANEKVRDMAAAAKAAGEGKVGFFYADWATPEMVKFYQGAVQHWAPNALNYRPAEMRERTQAGERTWFYHAPEPAIGLINLDANDIAMLTWGWASYKYNLFGAYDWAINFWSGSPYTNPRGHPPENGSVDLFYPGFRLKQIGFPTIEGPVISYRLKVLRRALQDHKYLTMIKAGGGDPQPLVDWVMTRAFADAIYFQGVAVTASRDQDASGKGESAGIDPDAWARDPEKWYACRRELFKALEDPQGYKAPANILADVKQQAERQEEQRKFVESTGEPFLDMKDPAQVAKLILDANVKVTYSPDDHTWLFEQNGGQGFNFMRLPVKDYLAKLNHKSVAMVQVENLQTNYARLYIKMGDASGNRQVWYAFAPRETKWLMIPILGDPAEYVTLFLAGGKQAFKIHSFNAKGNRAKNLAGTTVEAAAAGAGKLAKAGPGGAIFDFTDDEEYEQWQLKESEMARDKGNSALVTFAPGAGLASCDRKMPEKKGLFQGKDKIRVTFANPNKVPVMFVCKVQGGETKVERRLTIPPAGEVSIGTKGPEHKFDRLQLYRLLVPSNGLSFIVKDVKAEVMSADEKKYEKELFNFADPDELGAWEKQDAAVKRGEGNAMTVECLPPNLYHRVHRVLKDLQGRFQAGKSLRVPLNNHSQSTVKARVKVEYGDDSYTEENLVLQPAQSGAAKLSLKSGDLYRIGISFNGVGGGALVDVGNITME